MDLWISLAVCIANMIQLGNYKDGKLQKVTAGVSGIYDDDDDVAFWAGGKLEQAILTVMRFRNDPDYQPQMRNGRTWRTSLPLMVAIRSFVVIFMPWGVSSEVWLKPWADFPRKSRNIC